jgi:hypothetical protein
MSGLANCWSMRRQIGVGARSGSAFGPYRAARARASAVDRPSISIECLCRWGAVCAASLGSVPHSRVDAA